MTPYYDEHGITIYHGDCREVLPTIEPTACVTDPVWPNAEVALAGSDRPEALFAEAWRAMPGAVVRLAVQLGCDSDPAMLGAVTLPFFRVCWLEMACPHYKGRLLYTSDIGYLYGDPPRARKGAAIIPGKYISTDSNGREVNHPCPRKLAHVRFLVHRWTNEDDVVVDPFMGGGTTALACYEEGRSFIGIEVEEEYCERAAGRLTQGMLFSRQEAGNG